MSWVQSMLSDGIDGSVSSKRVVTFTAFVLCATAFISNLFWDTTIESFIFESMSYIAMAGLGSTVVEKFSTRNNYQQSTSINNNSQVRRTLGRSLPEQEDHLI